MELFKGKDVAWIYSTSKEELVKFPDNIDHMWFFVVKRIENYLKENSRKTLTKKRSKKDELISKTIKMVLVAWPNNSKEISKDEKSLFHRRVVLTVEKGCLFRGIRAVIPE